MYTLSTPVAAITGIGPTLAEVFVARGLVTAKDLLLFAPLRYEDRSHQSSISQLKVGELATIQATILSASQYYKGPRSIQSASVVDDEGTKLKLMWFNNRYIIDKLKKGETYLISGKLNDRGIMVQAVVEDVKDDTIHTNRLVPVYSLLPRIKTGSLRRLLKHLIDGLAPVPDSLAALASPEAPILDLHRTLTQLHFPDTEADIVAARERLALEELLSLMQTSQRLRQAWEKDKTSWQLKPPATDSTLIPATIPFKLTTAQLRATTEIMTDLQQATPMNRLLIGDVGSGKTVVAGIACYHTIHQGQHAALIAPTQILAEQHANTLAKHFPDLPIELVTGSSKNKLVLDKPSLIVGTHAIITKFEVIKPALVIYDEQHRFGVGHRSQAAQLAIHPHILTMSATPIPRTLMLTIFSHLDLSVIDELPAGRQPIKTWLVPEEKRQSSLEWMSQQIRETKQQALIVCPFIDPSNSLALENVAAVKDVYEKNAAFFAKHQQRVAILHGRQTKKEQAEITQKLYAHEIDVLVTTPIVEVGVDLPKASMIVIEAAERFGLASLHQLRGRVGRAGQAAYCLLFTNAKSETAQNRLKKFSHITKGAELAELDLEYRGAGDIFGTQQHGFDELQFASWANFELIAQARTLFPQLKNWQPLFEKDRPETASVTPLAN